MSRSSRKRRTRRQGAKRVARALANERLVRHWGAAASSGAWRHTTYCGLLLAGAIVDNFKFVTCSRCRVLVKLAKLLRLQNPTGIDLGI